jgi:hypothetical protein
MHGGARRPQVNIRARRRARTRAIDGARPSVPAHGNPSPRSFSNGAGLDLRDHRPRITDRVDQQGPETPPSLSAAVRPTHATQPLSPRALTDEVESDACNVSRNPGPEKVRRRTRSCPPAGQVASGFRTAHRLALRLAMLRTRSRSVTRSPRDVIARSRDSTTATVELARDVPSQLARMSTSVRLSRATQTLTRRALANEVGSDACNVSRNPGPEEVRRRTRSCPPVGQVASGFRTARSERLRNATNARSERVPTACCAAHRACHRRRGGAHPYPTAHRPTAEPSTSNRANRRSTRAVPGTRPRDRSRVA